MGWLDVRRTLRLQSVFPDFPPAFFWGAAGSQISSGFRQRQVLHPNPGAAGACENRRLEPLDELAHGDECLPLPLGGNPAAVDKSESTDGTSKIEIRPK